ncbi:MAG: zinc-ribbon domain-containing protein [Mailhella sp.]|nr:zinc-ribbon domain-containing protein [Mailhella sp.]
MDIVCPECGTKFRIPDDKFKENARFRCSVCKNVFSLSGSPAQETREEAPAGGVQPDGLGEGLSLSGSLPDASRNAVQGAAQDAPLVIQEGKKSHGLAWLFILLLIGLAGWGAHWALVNTSYLDGIKPWLYGNMPEQVLEWLPQIKQDKMKHDAPAVQKPAMEKLELREVRQYIVDNKNLGRVLVIEGKVRNNAVDPCDMIQLEADLCDSEGRPLMSKRQVAGAFISQMQLERLEKAELDELLNSKVSIISNNFNVRFGDEAPFTMLFADFPAEATDYRVRIAGASFRASKGNLAE